MTEKYQQLNIELFNGFNTRVKISCLNSINDLMQSVLGSVNKFNTAGLL